MADQIIRPADLPTERATPVPSEWLVVDNGVTVAKSHIGDVVTSGRPTATEAKAVAGTDSFDAMTPLTTKQSIASEVGVTLASRAQGDKADSAVQPGELAPVAISGAYVDLSGKPALGTAAAAATTDFATAAQGAKADAALQSVVAGANVTIDDTDPKNPVIASTGGAITDGDKGDIVVSGSGAVWSVKSLASPQGRVTLTSGVAVTTSDVAGAPTVYYVPSSGNRVPIYDGTVFFSRSIGAGLSLALDADSGHAGYHQSGRNFDAFIITDGGTIRLGTGPSWNAGAVAGSDTARGTGTGSTDLEMYEGAWVNKNAITIRFGSANGDTLSVPARRATYVGSFRTTANGQVDDTQKKRLVYNAYNQAPRIIFNKEPTDTWVYNIATWRQQNANVNNRIEVLAGLGGVLIDIKTTGRVSGSDATTRVVSVGIGVDKTTDDDSVFNRVGNGNNTAWAYPEAEYTGNISLGFHFFAVLEKGSTPPTVTFVSGGDKSSVTWGEVWL